MRPAFKYILPGAAHGVNDCIAGYIIGSLFYNGCAAFESGIYTLMYNVVAFGGQLVVARVAEALFLPKRFFTGSLLLLITALVVMSAAPALAVLLAGVASAVVHVTGGLEASRADDRAFGIGIFASPGVIGLIGGGFLAWSHTAFVLPGIITCGGLLLLFQFFYQPQTGSSPPVQRQEPVFEKHDVLMCIILMIISLRSFVWNLVQLAEQGSYNWLLVIALAAMCGKIAGGFLADYAGHKRYTLWALGLSLPFLTLFKKSLAGLSIGVFLLQSTIPATTVMIIKAVKRKPALAISLSFGLPILIAIALFYTPLIRHMASDTGILITLAAALALLVLYGRLLKKQKKAGL